MKTQLTPIQKKIKSMQRELDQFFERMIISQQKYSGDELRKFCEYWTAIYNRKQTEIDNLKN
jgi:hypothetical protein